MARALGLSGVVPRFSAVIPSSAVILSSAVIQISVTNSRDTLGENSPTLYQCNASNRTKMNLQRIYLDEQRSQWKNRFFYDLFENL